MSSPNHLPTYSYDLHYDTSSGSFTSPSHTSPSRRRSNEMYHPTQMMAATMGMSGNEHEKAIFPAGVSFPSSFFTSPYLDISAPHDAHHKHIQATKIVKANWRDRDCITWFLLIFVWTLNIILGVATYYLLANWAAVTWVVGSAFWTSLVMIIALFSLAYLFLSGMAILGFERGMKDSYLHLHDSPCALYTASCILPLLILTLFTCLALVTHTQTPITTSYMHDQTRGIINRADMDKNGKITYPEFEKYTFSLTDTTPSPISTEQATLLAHKNRFLHETASAPQPTSSPTPSTYQQQMIHTLFNQLNLNGDDHLSEQEIYIAMNETIHPQRQRYANAAGIIAIITFLFALIYWIMYRRLLSLGYHTIYRSLYVQTSPWNSHLTTPFMKASSPIQPRVASPDRRVIVTSDATRYPSIDDDHVHQHVTPRQPTPPSSIPRTSMENRGTSIMYDGSMSDDSSEDDNIHVDDSQRRPILRM